MDWRERGRMLSVTLVAGSLLAGATGCRTDADDVHRWANTAQGPRKIVAVITHDKYPLELRVEAAMTLVRMKPRGGRRLGIEQLTTALTELPPATRAKIVLPMIEKLEEAIRKAPPEGQAGQPPPPDPATADKDAAYAMLTHEGTSLIDDENAKGRLRAALIHWAATDFNRRLEDSGQTYGLEQVLRYLGADGVRALPNLITPNAKKIDKLADLIAELGDQKSKDSASEKLVLVASEVDSEKWVQQKTPSVEAANKASKLEPTKEQFKAQLDQYQEEELLRVFGSMKKVGGKATVGYLLGYASAVDKPEKRRATALAALEGHIDKNDKGQVEALLKIAEADDKASPPTVRDQSLRRIGELPRDLVVSRLYKLFENPTWKIRWVAAELVLKMGEAKHVPEFFDKLAGAKGLSITEPLRYGGLLKDLKGGNPVELADKYAKPGNSVNVRLSALGYYYEHGLKSERSKVDGYASDGQRVPECGSDAQECEWKCTVPSGKTEETKEIKTVGDFVNYCVIPAMDKRSDPPKKDTGKK